MKENVRARCRLKIGSPSSPGFRICLVVPCWKMETGSRGYGLVGNRPLEIQHFQGHSCNTPVPGGTAAKAVGASTEPPSRTWGRSQGTGRLCVGLLQAVMPHTQLRGCQEEGAMGTSSSPIVTRKVPGVWERKARQQLLVHCEPITTHPPSFLCLGHQQSRA